jgi:hypothetical protein
MSLSETVQALFQYNALREIQALVPLHAKVFATDAPQKDDVDSLRGAMLRTFSLVQSRSQMTPSIFPAWGSWGAFFSRSRITSVQNLPLQEVQDLERKLYLALSVYAKSFPINTIDLIDRTPITPETVCFSNCNGYQYRLTTIAEWIKHSNAWKNPESGLTMNRYDQEQLKALFLEHNISWEKPSPTLAEYIEHSGYTVEQLQALIVPQLRTNHIDTLLYLTAVKKLSFQDSIAEIQQLNYEQVDAIRELYDKGLRGNHLRGLEIDEDEYGPFHTLALNILTQEHHLDIEQAVAQISRCDFDQAQEFLYRGPTFP